MQNLICIIGTDGSGKTTLADAYVNALVARGEKADRVWLGAESYLMAPFRWVLRKVWGRGRKRDKSEGSGSQRKDYAGEIARKNATVQRYAWAVKLYLMLVWGDYRLQLAIKRWRTRGADTVVADRYLFDVAVNLGLTLGWSPGEVVAFIRSKLGALQLPQYRVFLRVSPEVSLERKDDILDIDYLHLRFSYYEAIARAFGFVERDGTTPIDESCAWLVEAVDAELARPHVLYVHANNHDIGGADKVLALMAQHMRAFGSPAAPLAGGYRTTVALRLQTAIVGDYARAGIPVIHSNFERPQVSKGLLGVLRLAVRAPLTLWFFWRLIRRERPDIVHVNDLYDFLPAMAARAAGVPVVWHIRMIATSAKMQRAFAGLVGRLATASVAVSHAVRDHYFPAGDDDPRNNTDHDARVIYDLGNARLVADDRDPSAPALPAEGGPDGLPEGRPLVIMVGRIEPWKGQDVFVKAVDALPEDIRTRAGFALVGGGVDAKEAFHAQVTSAAEAAGIACLGTRSDVPALLRAADVSVHASTSPDPFPGVVIESLLSGAATIAANAGGAVEMIEHGTSGFLTTPGDPSALSEALEGLLAAPEPPRARFGAAARARGLSLVDASHIDQSVHDLYQSLLTPPAR